MRVIGYARVSTMDQDLSIQIQELKKFCEYRGFELIKIYTDKSTGANIEREGFTDMMKSIEKNTQGIEGVIVYKIDRMGRSLKNLLDIIDTFGKNHIQFISITDNFDTTTNQGVLFFQVIGAIAEYERKLIKERTELGIKQAMKDGVRFGRPKKKVDMVAIKADISAGIPKTKVCKKYGIGKSYLYNKLGGA
jgi:DNA invertase Pin-like site-specific DNA recombinase